jgi:glycerol-3-phosphate dehydrogenase (NAD(P)+)
MNMKIAVIGSGAWGTAIAKAVAEKGHETLIWSHNPYTADEINRRRRNSRYLPEVELPETLHATSDIHAAADGREYLILALPSLFLMDGVKQMLNADSIREGKSAIAVLTKGFLPTARGPRLILETLEDYLPGFYRNSLVYIAGPSHAEEVSRGRITGLIAASENPKNSFRFRDLIKSNRLLVFSSFDVRGVQVAAAVKNVIAIAFGILDALKTGTEAPSGAFPSGLGALFGDGTESLLLAAGLNEIQALGFALGAGYAETFTSISGVGDLDVTCRSVFGRNRRFGRDIIEKDILAPYHNLEDLLSRITEIGYLPEGVAAAKYAAILAKKHKLKLPIISGVYRIINKEISVADFIYTFLEEPAQADAGNLV